MLITNRMRRPFIVPRVKDKQGNLSKIITIMGGKSVDVDDNLWKEASKSKAIRALIAQRCLDVKPGHAKAESIDDEDLQNAEPKTAPDDLSADKDDDRLNVETSQIAVDAPTGGKKSTSKKTK